MARARKSKKKHWFQITAPTMFRNQSIGEIYLYDAAAAIGRSLKVNLMNLTGDIKRQNINIRFEIKEVKEGKLWTYITGYEIVPTAIKRMVRRRSSKIMLSFPAKTSDNKTIKIKPIILTRGTIKQSILTILRKEIENAMKAEIKNFTFNDLLQNLINYRFQMKLKRYLKKIHPIKIVEIKELRLLKAK